jgi:hypothetical protein
MTTKASGSIGIGNQNAAYDPDPAIAQPPGITTGSGIVDRTTAGEGGFTNNPQPVLTGRNPSGVGPQGLLEVEQAYAKPTDASTPSALGPGMRS